MMKLTAAAILAGAAAAVNIESTSFSEGTPCQEKWSSWWCTTLKWRNGCPNEDKSELAGDYDKSTWGCGNFWQMEDGRAFFISCQMFEVLPVFADCFK